MMLVYANLHTSPNTPLCVALASPTSKCGLPGLPHLLVWPRTHPPRVASVRAYLGTSCDMILPPWTAVLCGHTAVMAAFVPFRHYMTAYYHSRLLEVRAT